MAAFARTSPISLHPDHPHHQTPQTHKPKALSFSHNLHTHHLSFKNTQELSLSVINTSSSSSSITTHNPNSDICELCLAGNLEKALKHLDSMQELQIFVEEDAYVALLRLCEWKRAYDEGTRVYSYVSNSTSRLSVRLGNALLSMFVRFGDLGNAWYVFGKMEERDVFSWNVLVGGYAKSGFFDEALDLYHRMLWVDLMTMTSVISACELLGDERLGEQVHGYVIRTEFGADVSVYNSLIQMTGHMSYVLVANTLIDMYSKCKCIDKALDVFHSIPEKNVISWTSIMLGLRINNRSFETLIFFRQMKLSLKPNSVTLISVLSACARIGALMCGKEIHAHALRTGVGLDGFLPNALLDMYVRCGRMRPAWNQFNTHKQDVAAWNILLTGYAERGQGAHAVELFQRMVGSNVNPDDITFISLLCACSRSGMVTEGLEYFHSMQHKYCITPNQKHYACVVDLLGRAGKLEDAHEFILKMPIEPDPAIWGALLNACRILRQVELGELAARHIFEKDTTSVGYYILLCNLYADSGKWDEVAKVRKTMRQRGLIVDPGCSWVEIKGKVHAFLSGDNFHPQIMEIKAVLEGFYEKMKAAGFNGPEKSSMGEVEASKAEIFCGHSERLAIAYALINTAPGMPIWVTKNLFMCQSCHNTVKFITKVVRREISVRDTQQFHHFKDGLCSCGDVGYWGKSNM
ncbi:pentatricopeptide repeat-containing protein [Quercus suber]|uniref:Pentatricopeptide repeat-containing protein n=1 Tax=Quercus suber TaxID=58331 RepID=A0AAW0K8J2_QUESU